MAAKKVSGPSGKNKQKAFNLHEKEKGQIERWRSEAKRLGENLSDWIRKACDERLGRRK